MTDSDQHEETAIDALARREYVRAGDAYTRTAWATLAEPRENLNPFEADEQGWVGDGLRALALAAVAYRVARQSDRATRRAVEGVAITRDLESALDQPVQRGCLAEFVADFRTVGSLDGIEDAYRDAESAYSDLTVTDPKRWATTPLFEAATGIIQQVARGSANGEIAVEWADLHGSDPSAPGEFLAARARYKRQRFPGLVERAVADGYLAAPRGTTAYGTDSYRCPDCGSTDVNWTGDHTLCLRCSTPMGRQ